METPRTNKKSTIADEWDKLPFSTQLRIPITASVPMFFRWKIMQAKLFIADLEYVAKHYELKSAEQLRVIMLAELDDLMELMMEHIVETRNIRSEM